MTITWTPYEDPLSRFVTDHPSWDGDEDGEPDGYRAGKSAWSSGEQAEPYDGPLANTALGLLGLNKEKLAFCTYSLWVARTDFDVTRRHLHALAQLTGVEVLRPLTRYAFLLGVGPQFEAAAVKSAAEDLLDPPPVDRVAVLAEHAADTYAAWAVAAGPGGELELLTGESHESVDAQLKSLGDFWEAVRRG
jgi:hypothetical protein